MFEFPELLVGDDEEVPRTARGVEHFDFANAVEQCLELADAVEPRVQLVLQLVEEQRLDRLQDVRYGGVVLAEVRSLSWRDDRLEHRSEYVRVDFVPEQATALDQQVTGLLVEFRDRVVRLCREEATIDIRELGEVGRFRCPIWHVEDPEQVCEELVDVGAVQLGEITDCFGELGGLEDPCVFGEETEQQPGEEHIEGVPGLRRTMNSRVHPNQFIEQLRHALSGLNVRMRFASVLGFLHTGPRQEEREVLVDVVDRDREGFVGLCVDREQFLVISHDDEPAAVPDYGRRGSQAIDDAVQVVGRGLEVDDILLADLSSRVIGDVQRAVPQSSDVAG